MKDRKAHEWVDIKELTPLKFMPYMAKLFWDITGRDLKGLSDYMGRVGLGGYYHWKLLELGQLSACPCLQGQPVPDGPIARPSGQPPCRPAQTGALAAGASGRHQGRNQPTSGRGRNPPISNWGRKPASVARGGKWAASGGPVDLPSEREGAGNSQSWFKQSVQETEGGAGECHSPLYPIGTAPARWEAMNMWLVKTRLPAMLPQRLFEPITLESRLKWWKRGPARYSAWYPSTTWPVWPEAHRSPALSSPV